MRLCRSIILDVRPFIDLRGVLLDLHKISVVSDQKYQTQCGRKAFSCIYDLSGLDVRTIHIYTHSFRPGRRSCPGAACGSACTNLAAGRAAADWRPWCSSARRMTAAVHWGPKSACWRPRALFPTSGTRRRLPRRSCAASRPRRCAGTRSCVAFRRWRWRCRWRFSNPRRDPSASEKPPPTSHLTGIHTWVLGAGLRGREVRLMSLAWQGNIICPPGSSWASALTCLSFKWLSVGGWGMVYG